MTVSQQVFLWLSGISFGVCICFAVSAIRHRPARKAQEDRE